MLLSTVFVPGNYAVLRVLPYSQWSRISMMASHQLEASEIA